MSRRQDASGIVRPFVALAGCPAGDHVTRRIVAEAALAPTDSVRDLPFGNRVDGIWRIRRAAVGSTRPLGEERETSSQRIVRRGIATVADNSLLIRARGFPYGWMPALRQQRPPCASIQYQCFRLAAEQRENNWSLLCFLNQQAKDVVDDRDSESPVPFSLTFHGPPRVPPTVRTDCWRAVDPEHALPGQILEHGAGRMQNNQPCSALSSVRRRFFKSTESAPAAPQVWQRAAVAQTKLSKLRATRLWGSSWFARLARKRDQWPDPGCVADYDDMSMPSNA